MAVSGYSAANTVPTSKGGDGAGTISGYTISTVKYTLNSTDPRNIDTVTFNTDVAPPSGATVKIRLVSSGSTWYSCTFSGTAVTCIAVTGNSMEPGLKNGDLAIVRAADHYTVGEIALYRHPQIGPVIHRIIGRQDDEHFSFQGDNNTWVDSYTPGAADLLGAL